MPRTLNIKQQEMNSGTKSQLSTLVPILLGIIVIAVITAVVINASRNDQESAQDTDQETLEEEFCSSGGIAALVPTGWECRMMSNHVVIYTDQNQLTVALGQNRVATLCADPAAECTTENVTLSSNFSGLEKSETPSGSVEIVGSFAANDQFTLRIFSQDAISAEENTQIVRILDSAVEY